MTSVLVAIPDATLEVLLTPQARQRLEAATEVWYAGPGPIRELPEGTADRFDVAITGWGTPANQDLIGSKLRLLVHTAGSFRTIIPAEVLTSGVRLSQAGSDPMAKAVAEAALSLELMLLRHLHTYDRQMQNSRDYKASRTPEYGDDIATVRHGLVGLSRVGVWHAKMLRGLGAEQIVAYDPYWEADQAAALGVRLVGFDELFANSDVVAIHAPVTDDTRGMVGARQFAALPDGGIVVNTARAAVIDNEALEAELVSGRLRAGLDVFAEEPLPASSKLYGLPNVILTPHIAGATRQARFAQGDAMVDEVLRWAAGEPLQFEVDPEAYARLS